MSTLVIYTTIEYDSNVIKDNFLWTNKSTSTASSLSSSLGGEQDDAASFELSISLVVVRYHSVHIIRAIIGVCMSFSNTKYDLEIF
jgi:hypothetical protein